MASRFFISMFIFDFFVFFVKKKVHDIHDVKIVHFWNLGLNNTILPKLIYPSVFFGVLFFAVCAFVFLFSTLLYRRCRHCTLVRHCYTRRLSYASALLFLAHLSLTSLH